MVPYTKIALALLVILETSQALPVSQKNEKNVEEEIEIPIDEAKEFKYELNRDHELQGSLNGGQSGWALEQIAHGAKPQEVVLGSIVRRKRQTGVQAAQAPSDAQAEEEPAVTTEEPAPIVNEAYAQRLAGSAIYKALALAGAKRQSIERGPGGYGRKKRMSVDQDEIEVILQPNSDPIEHAYAQMFSQSSNPEEVLLMAETIKKTEKTNRTKRQSISFEEEAIMQEIFPVEDEENEIVQPIVLVLKPKIKSWGESGLVKNQN